jgi:Tfp pilus assembly protein PilO
MTMTRRWSLLAVVAVVGILAAGWFLLVAPKHSEAASLNDKTSQQEAANGRLQQQIEMLKAQQADLPRQRARLAQLGRQMPDNPALPSLVRSLTDASRKTGVSLDNLAPSNPVALVTALSAVAPAAPATTDGSAPGSETGTETGAATGAAVPSTGQPATALYQVPLTLNVTGSYFELEQFVSKLEGLKRSLLVTGFTLGAPKSGDAAPGSLGLTLEARVFLAPPAAATASTTTPVAPATAGN